VPIYGGEGTAILLVEDARELSSSSFIDARDENEDERVHKVREYIAENYMRDISLQALADMTCMNADAFARFFKNKTGRTPNRYIIDYRLGIAARMLLTSHMSVAEIGYSCGFNTLSHFNRLFRESKGCTPSEFRERFYPPHFSTANDQRLSLTID
jgi:transcriptional regulator GlxA family with amidase domain